MENMSKKLCGYCKSEFPTEQEFCSVCGKQYIPLICNSCKTEVTSLTKFCTSCGKKIKSLRDKKRCRIVTIASIAVAAALIISLCLVLFIPYQKIEYCDVCVEGKVECTAKWYEEQFTGKKIYNHDCGLCENGYSTCEYCGGDYWNWVSTNNFREWL